MNAALRVTLIVKSTKVAPRRRQSTFGAVGTGLTLAVHRLYCMINRTQACFTVFASQKTSFGVAFVVFAAPVAVVRGLLARRTVRAASALQIFHHLVPIVVRTYLWDGASVDTFWGVTFVVRTPATVVRGRLALVASGVDGARLVRFLVVVGRVFSRTRIADPTSVGKT